MRLYWPIRYNEEDEVTGQLFLGIFTQEEIENLLQSEDPEYPSALVTYFNRIETELSGMAIVGQGFDDK
jgi:hypothetical protein